MENTQLKKFCSAEQKGTGLTGLILIVILLTIGFIAYKSLTKPDKKKYWSSKWTSEEIENAKVDAYISDEDFWNEYHLIAAKIYNVPIDLTPRKEQSQITEEITINGLIHKNNEQSGKLSITISPNGTIRGKWEGKIPKNKRQSYRCELEGHFYPEAKHRKDPGKLFLVGRVRKVRTIGDSSRPDCRIYIRGWLDRDYTASGKILFYDPNSDLREGVVLDCTLIDTFDWEGRAN